MGPPGMSGEIVQRWTDTMVRLAKDADWLAGNAKLGGIPAVRSPQDTERFVREQHALYEKLVARLGLRE
jgi:tripartite-type tricarboxylate transporter receptor subunit TctC